MFQSLPSLNQVHRSRPNAFRHQRVATPFETGSVAHNIQHRFSSDFDVLQLSGTALHTTSLQAPPPPTTSSLCSTLSAQPINSTKQPPLPHHECVSTNASSSTAAINFRAANFVRHDSENLGSSSAHHNNNPVAINGVTHHQQSHCDHHHNHQQQEHHIHQYTMHTNHNDNRPIKINSETTVANTLLLPSPADTPQTTVKEPNNQPNTSPHFSAINSSEMNVISVRSTTINISNQTTNTTTNEPDTANQTTGEMLQLVQLTDLHKVHRHQQQLTKHHHHRHHQHDLFVSAESSASSSSSSSTSSLYSTTLPSTLLSFGDASTKAATQKPLMQQILTDEGEYDHQCTADDDDDDDDGGGGVVVRCAAGDDGLCAAGTISRDRAVSRVEPRTSSGSAQCCAVAVDHPPSPSLSSSLSVVDFVSGAACVDSSSRLLSSSQSESVHTTTTTRHKSSVSPSRSRSSSTRFAKSVHHRRQVACMPFEANANGSPSVVSDSKMRLNVPASSVADNAKVIAAAPNHTASMYVGGHESRQDATPISASATDAAPPSLMAGAAAMPLSRDLVVNTATGVCVVNCYSCDAIPAVAPSVPNTSALEMCATNRTTVQVHVVHNNNSNNNSARASPITQSAASPPQLDNRNTNRCSPMTAATTLTVAAAEEPTTTTITNNNSSATTTTTATVHQSAVATSAEAAMSREQRRRERRERRAARQAARMHAGHVHPMPSVVRPAFAEILPDILNHHHHQYAHHHLHNPTAHHIHSTSSSASHHHHHAPSPHNSTQLHVPPPYTALTLNTNNAGPSPALPGVGGGGHFHHQPQLMAAMAAGITLVPPPVTSAASCITAAVAAPNLGAGTDGEGRYSFPLPIIRR